MRMWVSPYAYCHFILFVTIIFGYLFPLRYNHIKFEQTFSFSQKLPARKFKQKWNVWSTSWYWWRTKFCRYNCSIDKITLCFDEVIYGSRYPSWNMSYCFPSFEIFLFSMNGTSVCVNFFGTLTRFRLNINLTSSSSLSLLQEVSL